MSALQGKDFASTLPCSHERGGIPPTPVCLTEEGKNSLRESGLQGYRLRMLPMGEAVGGKGKKKKKNPCTTVEALVRL